MKKVYGYARVSTKEQHLDRQLKALLDFGIEERDIVTDKSSGMSMDREGYQMLKTRLLRDGDTLVIKSLDRLSRNKGYIKAELEYFKQRHIRVMVLDLPTTLVELPEGQEWVFEMINNILIEVLASIAEQERLTTRQRQEEGIAVAKEQENISDARKRSSRQTGKKHIKAGSKVNDSGCCNEAPRTETKHIL